MFLDDIENPPIYLRNIGFEKQTSAEYYFDCNKRFDNCYLFQYTLSGQGVFKNGDNKYTMTKDMSFFIHMPGDHIYYLPENSESWELIYIIFSGTEVKAYFDKIIENTGNVICFDSDSRLLNLFLHIFTEAQNGNITDAFMASGLTHQFLMELCRTVLQKDKTKYSARICSAISLIEENYKKAYGPEELADALNISKNHLIREFTKEVGLSPGKYISKMKIQEAANLLLNSKYSVDEIAKLCGYSCGNYFSKVFNGFMSMTPSEFRKLNLFSPSIQISL